MKDEEVIILVRRIRQELGELQRVLSRIQEGWELFRRSNEDLYLDGVALNLHGLYSGFERLFTRIAETIDGNLPQGAEWHKLLLGQMKVEIPGVSPLLSFQLKQENFWTNFADFATSFVMCTPIILTLNVSKNWLKVPPKVSYNLMRKFLPLPRFLSNSITPLEGL